MSTSFERFVVNALSKCTGRKISFCRQATCLEIFFFFFFGGGGLVALDLGRDSQLLISIVGREHIVWKKSCAVKGVAAKET